MVVDLFDVADGIPDDLNPVQLLPNRALPHPEAVARLQALIERVPVTTLRAFLEDLFSDDAIALPFVERPASRDHHHAYPGGLVEHSLEVAERVAWFLFRDVPTEAKALAVVAGLLHDIGKVRTFGPDYRKTTVGTLLGHDQLTLEILSGPLRRLETKWPDGADSLRYLLSWNEYRDRGRTLIPEALAIRNADRFSAARDAQRRAFAGARSHQRLARLRGYGPPSTFWLPRPPP
ncbi:MAG: HD domain-containing protein [Arhodomonas sp.]|nr:HD domain-containing protein [Arhodomonas sp.]